MNGIIDQDGLGFMKMVQLLDTLNNSSRIFLYLFGSQNTTLLQIEGTKSRFLTAQTNPRKTTK